MRWLIKMALLTLWAGTAAAQMPHRPAGDTLRFLQTTKSDTEIQTSMGPQQMKLAMETHLVLAFLGGDSAVAWVDSIHTTGMPPSIMQSTFDQLQGKLVRLRFLPDGRVESGDLSPAALGLTGSSDFTAGQWGFSMPVRGDLRRGSAWSDTVTMKVDTMGAAMTMSTITRYEVLGDSVYEGMPVVVVATSLANSAKGSGGDATATLQINGSGQGTGRAYYSRALGLVVHSVTGMQTSMTSEIGSMSMHMKAEAESTTRLLRK